MNILLVIVRLQLPVLLEPASRIGVSLKGNFILLVVYWVVPGLLNEFKWA